MRHSTKKGFSLLETVMAMAVLAFMLCAILLAYITFSFLASLSGNIAIATNAAEGVVEEIRSSSFPQIFAQFNGLNFILNDIPQSRGVVFINNANPDLLVVRVIVCWRQANRVIGEDQNLNGVLNAGEDTNANGVIDSPVELVTLIANR